MAYKPYKKGREILNRAMEHIKSVDYKVSLRWVFYRLLQEGYYNKKDYQSWVQASSRARHAFFGEWRPYSLADETRNTIGDSRQTIGSETVRDCIEDLKVGIFLNSMYGQKYYIEVWFEAKAMSSQFKKYVSNMVLRPMGGQPSIPFKWEAAKALEEAYSKYDHDIIVLYFGDCDDAGGTIFETVKRDVASWCDVPFKMIHCGLTLQQALDFKLPTNEDDKYQWEALTDKQAKKLITDNVSKYFDDNIRHEYREREDKAQILIDGYIEELKEKVLDSLE